MKGKLVWAALLFAILFSLITLPRMLRLDSPDFKVFHVAAKHALYQPENLYKVSPDRYLYPPVTAILLAPFGFSEHWKAHQISWHLLLFLLFWFFASRSWPFFFTLLILNRYFAINFGYGQINPLVLYLVFLTSLSLKKSSSLTSSFFWPLAGVLKVYPLVQGLEFLQQKRWKELFLAFLVFLLLIALPFLVWGKSLAIDLHLQFLQALQSKGLPVDSGNQSLSALAIRIFTDQPFELHPLGEFRWGWIPLSPVFVKYAPIAIGIILFLFTWKKAWQRKLYLDGTAAFGFSLLFLSHIVWKDYFIFLIFALVQILQIRPNHWKRTIGIYIAMVYLSSPEVLTHQISARLDALSIHFLAAVWIWFHWMRLPPSSSTDLN